MTQLNGCGTASSKLLLASSKSGMQHRLDAPAGRKSHCRFRSLPFSQGIRSLSKRCLLAS